MSNGNPWGALRDAVDRALAVLPTVKRVQGVFNGEDWAALAGQAARDGASVWTRVAKQEIMPNSPPFLDCSKAYVHLIVAAPATADRGLAAANAEQVAWDCYAALRQSKVGLAWLHRPLYFEALEIEHQTPNCTIASLVLSTVLDLATWTE